MRNLCKIARLGKRHRLVVMTVFLLGCVYSGYSQQDRFQLIEQRLKMLAATVPGLNQKADFSISNGSLQEFLRGLATTHDLNLDIDPSLNQRITNNFSEEKVSNILLYLAKQYNLDFNFIGSIITITPYRDPLANLPPLPKELKITYNGFGEKVTMDLQNDSLINIAKKITQFSGKNIIVMPELYNKLISGYIQDMPIQSALEKLAISNAFKINTTRDSAIVLEPLKADEEIVAKQNPNPNSNYRIRKLNRNPGAPGSSSVEVSNDSSGRKNVTLNVIDAPIKDVIKNIADQAGINYFVYTELAGNITANVNNLGFEQVLGLILQKTKYTYSYDNDVYLIGERKEEGIRAKKLIQLHFRSVDSLIQIIPQELSEGVEVKEFKELNGILLSGSEPHIKEIEAFINQVDKVVPMITLEVILLDINKTRNITTGISAGTSDSVHPGGSLLGAGGLNYTFGSQDINKFLSAIGLNNVFNLGRVTPNFYVNISALENNNNVNQRQTPKLSTLNGHTANLSIGNTQYYSITTQNVLGSLSPQTVVTQQFIPVEANLSIDITPFVSGDDEVTMNIAVNISNFTATTPINQPPPVATSKFKSIIRVRNGDMIILGGIENTTKSESSSGVPFLSRIPILKWIFSSRSKTNSKIVSVVFIKPTIIYK